MNMLPLIMLGFAALFSAVIAIGRGIRSCLINGNVPSGEGFFRWASRFFAGILTDFKENRGGTAEKDPPFGYVDIFQTRPNARARRIRCEGGVERAGYIPLGGMEQYIQVHGREASNPVLLMLHGGPGRPMSQDAYAWQGALEERFTVVHWDQRGCGNTYARGRNPEKPTLELLLGDLDALVEALRSAYGKEKVLLLGHSWGTLLGGIYAEKHPEKISAYISVSQMLDFRASERASAQEAIRLAGGSRDARKIQELLEAVTACQRLDRAGAARLMKLRRLKEKYLPPQSGGQKLSQLLFSPDLTWGGLQWMLRFDRMIESNSALYEEIFTASSACQAPVRYEVPVILAAGSWDWTNALFHDGGVL